MQWPSTDRDTEIVCHVYYNPAPRMSAFFMRDMNKEFAEITGAKVNRGAGYGLEVPCIYHLCGPNVYADKMELFEPSLLMDVIIHVVTLLNGNWHFKINGYGQWLFLEVNLYCFYSLGSWLLVVGWR